MQKIAVTFLSHNRKPKCAPNPAYPDGMEIDLTDGKKVACLAELRVWADGLHDRHNMKGKVCNIWKAHWVAKDGSGAAYRGNPHQVVYGA